MKILIIEDEKVLADSLILIVDGKKYSGKLNKA